MKKLLLGLALLGIHLIMPMQIFAREKVVLQLSWKHQFQFAGYYAALEKGFYNEAGFDVEIREASETTNTLEEVLNGNAQFAIGDTEILIFYLEGKPIVLLASIFQHSPSVLLVKATSNIYTPQDVIGKSLMAGEGFEGLEILTMLYSEGIKKDQVKLVPQSFSINELLTDKVDALGAYVSNEPYFMEKFGIPFRIINPTNYGVDFYSDCLYCSQKLLKTKPDKVKKFREASIKGWEYALANPEEIAKLIVSKYKPSKTLDHVLFEAGKVKELINADFIEIGHTNKWRWQRIGEYLYQQGIIQNLSSIDEFIYTPEQSSKYLWIKVLSIIFASMILTLTLFFLFEHRIKRSVERRTEHIQSLVKSLEERNLEIQKINEDLIKARELAKELDESRFYFFAKIINELKAPVKAMIDLTDQISKPNIAGEKKQAISTRLVFNSKIVFDFINDIIAIANVNESSENTSFELVNVNQLLAEIIDTIRNEHRLTPKISLYINQPELVNSSDLVVLFDQVKVTRILIKLIKNAIKFTENGSIEVGFETNAPNSLLLWVKDTGVGIKSDSVKRINSFLHNPLQGNASGIGLGLWVCKNLINQMKGHIWVESETDASKSNRGTNFSFQVPCVYIENLSYSDEEVDDKSTKGFAGFKGKTLLVLDKYVYNYNLIKALTKGAGFNLLYTNNSDDMLSALKGFKKVDLLMMNADNISAVMQYPFSEIKKLNPLIPILAHISGDQKDNESLIKMGFNDILQIPPKQDNFINTLANHLT